MVLSLITKDRARRSRRAGLRNTATHEYISLRGIAVIDASVNHNRSAALGASRRRRNGSGGSRRRRTASGGSWRRGRRAAAAQPCYSQSVDRTRSGGSDVAHDYDQRLTIGNLNLECLIRIWAEA